MTSCPSRSTIKQACRDGHGGSSTPSDSACSNTVKKRPLARCGCGSTPKISGISHGFSSVMPSSLLRGASFQDTNARPLIYRDVKDPPALQLTVSRWNAAPGKFTRSTQHYLGYGEVVRGAQGRIRRASPIRHRIRHAQNTSTVRQPRGRIIDGFSSGRSGDSRSWEGDLITGSQNTHISHFGGPSVAFTLFVKMQGKDTNSVVTALSTQIRQLTAALR